MASTIADFDLVPGPFADQPTELEREGVRVLAALTSRSRLPVSHDEEVAALRLLARLAAPGPPPASLDVALEDLRRKLASLGRADVQYVLDWIAESGRRHFDALRGAGARRQRLRLLFVLLAAVFEPTFAAPVFPYLREMGIARTQEDFERLLAWIPRRPASADERNLAAEYLEVVARTMFRAFDVPDTGSRAVTQRMFASWSWMRRLLHLIARNVEWEQSLGSAPGERFPASCDASRFEFELARSARFGALVRDGGPVARVLLSRMGHADLPTSLRGGYRAAWLPAAIALLLTILLLVAAGVRLDAWNRANASDALEIVQSSRGSS